MPSAAARSTRRVPSSCGESIESGALFQSETWKTLVSNCTENGKAFHFLGLLSDGNVHSNIRHLFALLRHAHAEGVKRAYCHILLDGRDVPATSALEYVAQLEDLLRELNDRGLRLCHRLRRRQNADHHGPL